MYELITNKQVREWIDPETDVNLDFYDILRRAVSTLIENYTCVKFVTRQYTELHSGNDGNTLVLGNYPAYDSANILTVHISSTQLFEAATLVASTTYVVDEEAGAIQRNIGYNFPAGINNIQVVYKAGYSKFVVVAGQNDKLDISNTGGTETITLAAGTYDGPDLAAEVQAKLQAASVLNDAANFTASYNYERQAFAIEHSAEVFNLLWNSGASKLANSGILMGYDTGNDRENTQCAESDDGVTGLPEDLVIAASYIIYRWASGSARIGDSTANIQQKTSPASNQVTTFRVEDIPKEAKFILDSYKRFS